MCRLVCSLFAFAFGLVAVSSFAQDKVTPDRVFLLIGQSNMAGRAALEKGDDQPIPHVLLLDDHGQWIPATSPLNRFATDRKELSMQRISPGVGFACGLTKRLPDTTVGLISNARGGTSVEEWQKGRPLYDNTLKRLQAVERLKVDGVIWHQGEANRDDPKYLDKLQRVIESLRADLNSPNLPFVAGEIYGEAPVNGLLRQLPETVPATGVASAAGLTVIDKVHFDRKSQLTLGERYAEQMLELIGK
ncbi:sialate O-acetylesterase [bacterium]|nr:sialate O-acetylesterase [bacterium]